jgi:uncharacterized repeat protein (TIGR03803 family)
MNKCCASRKQMLLRNLNFHHGLLAALIQSTDGNFYGTTGAGGANYSCPGGCGTIFKITPSGALTTLINLGPGSTGYSPLAPLLQATNGNFYGTAEFGGHSGSGTVFGLSVGLGPFVAPQPTFGPAGTVVRILGTKLTAANAVTFNGIPAPFKVVSPTFIKTVVPPGATTGPIEVETPAGTLKSNPPFTVVQ